MRVNQNYRNLKESYLFAEVNKRAADYAAKNKDKKLIRLGIGDVTLPLCKAVIDSMSEAVAEMGEKSSFRGYGPYEGYDFLLESIAAYYRDRLGVQIGTDEIFVSDGAKSDVGNITDIFGAGNTVLIPDPVYPVYLDSNIMAGNRVVFLPAKAESGFLPLPSDIPDGEKVDIIYICSPNNPTGATYTREGLKEWVDFALGREALILFDAAYEAYISEDKPHSIFEIEGARKCAIEFCSFSKTAAFTGTRCAFTVIPRELEFEGVSIAKLWLRRQSTKYNGVCYIVQRGAAAALSDEGLEQVKESIAYYMKNASILAEVLREKGVWFTGGVNSPYIWLRCPLGMKSWEFFDYLLENAALVGTPGAGFGENGEGFFRLTAFGEREATIEAAERIRKLDLG